MAARALVLWGVLLLAHGTAGAVTLGADPSQTDASSGQLSVDILADIDVIQFDLQMRWDPDYLVLTAIDPGRMDLMAPGTVVRDDALGFIDDLFGDVGLADPIAAGTPLLTLVFDVIGFPNPLRDVIEVGNLLDFDDFFERDVLLAKPDFSIEIPPPDRSRNALVTTVPEPSTAVLVFLGLTGLAALRRA